MKTPSKISIIIPVYQGGDYAERLVAALEATARDWTEASGGALELAEAIFVSDDAKDNSEEILRGLAVGRNWMRIIILSRNFGQHSATMAGILYASGDWVVTLDEDLQHRPEDIWHLLKHAVRNHLDIVYGKAERMVHGSMFRDGGSRFAKRVLARFLQIRGAEHFNSFRLIRGSIARAAASVAAHDSYVDVLFGWFTQRVDSVVLPMEDRRYQEFGISGYNLRRLLSHCRKLVFASQLKVLRAGFVLGVCMLLSTLGLIFYLFVMRVTHPEAFAHAAGWLSLMTAHLFIGGVMCSMLSLIIESLSSMSRRQQGMPAFFVVDRDSDDAVCKAMETRGQ